MFFKLFTILIFLGFVLPLIISILLQVIPWVKGKPWGNSIFVNSHYRGEYLIYNIKKIFETFIGLKY
jgi:hypothetical protein